MDIREINPTAEDVYEPYVRIANTVVPEHPISVKATYHNDKVRDKELVHRRFIFNINAKDVGIALVAHMEDMHHPQRFYIDIMVLPEHRNQGIGGQIHAYLVQLLKQEYDANQLHSSVSERYPFSIRFLEKRGFQQMMREWESRLPLADFDDTKFGDWRGRLEANNIVLKSWADLMTDPANLHKLHDLEALIEEDVPTSQASTKVPFKTWIAHRQSDNTEFLPDGYIVALHNDDYIGTSSLWGNDGTKNLYVGLTGVLPQYRRKGIALALKTQANLWAKSQGYEAIYTWNEQDNPMLDLNLKLGFIKQPAEVEMMMRLE